MSRPEIKALVLTTGFFIYKKLIDFPNHPAPPGRGSSVSEIGCKFCGMINLWKIKIRIKKSLLL